MIERIIIRGYRLFRDFEMEPTAGLNIVVGDNEAGKSTLLEAISLGLTGRVNGRRAEDELNPYWFNQDMSAEYFAAIAAGESPAPPEILIELYLDDDTPDIQALRAVYNSRAQDAPGMSVCIRPSEDYAQEFAAYIHAEHRPNIIPVEYYEVVWKDFSGALLQRRPKGLVVLC